MVHFKQIPHRHGDARPKGIQTPAPGIRDGDRVAWAQFDMAGLVRHIASDAKERLRTLIADESRTWVEIDDLVLEGRANREILHQAETMTADLIVMGAQGHSGLDLAVFGSSTQYVVRIAKCPVLVVPAPSQN